MSLTPQVPTQSFNPAISQGLSIGTSGELQGGAINPPASTQASLLMGNAPTVPAIRPTPTGGIDFSGVVKPQVQTPTITGSDASRTFTTPSGAKVSTNSDGSISNVSNVPNYYNINTNGAIPSNAVTTNTSIGDINNTHNSYNDALQSLAAAKGYSDQYLAAYKANQQAQLNSAATNSNFYTGNNLPGDTLNYAQGATAKQQAQNTLTSAESGIQLQAQELQRQGNIAGAAALVQGYSPQSVAPGSALVNPATGGEIYSGLGGYQAVQGIQNTNSLAAQFPDAGINPTTDSYTVAQAKAAASGSFQARNLQQITLPGGGISFVNKNQITTDPKTGQTAIISSAQAAQADALKGAIDDSQKGLTQVQSALTTADQNFPLLLSTMKADGVNDFGSPLANQLQKKVESGFTGALAPYNALITSLQATYSQIVARGGTVDDNTRNTASKLLSGDLSYNDLSNLYKTLKQESQNVVNGYTSQIQTNSQQLNAIYGQAQPLSTLGTGANSGSSTGGYISPSQATW